MSKVYHVVEFLDDGSTYVVPEWWLQRSRLHVTAFWPPYKGIQQVLHAMRRKEPATRHWTEHQVKILYSYATLHQAVRKVEDAEEPSSSNSDGNDEPVQKRGKKSAENRPVHQHEAAIEQSRYEERIYYGPDKADLKPALPHAADPPQLMETASPNVQRAASSMQCLRPASPSAVLHEANPPGRTEMASPNGSWRGRWQREQRHQPFSAAAGDPRESGSDSVQEEMMAACRELLERQAKMSQEFMEKQTAYWEKTLRIQADILVELKALRQQGLDKAVSVPTLPEGCPPLPVNTTDAMRELNRYLGDREKLQAMAQYFSHMGGYDFKAAARTVLGMVIGHPVALCCSWAGSKGSKEAFCEQDNIVSLVLVSIQPRYPNVNKAIVSTIIKKWLYSSGDRDGGRTNRKLDSTNEEK